MRKKNVKKTKRFRNNRSSTEHETFIYPMGIKSIQSVNESHFFSFATIVATVDDRWTECNKIRNGVINLKLFATYHKLEVLLLVHLLAVKHEIHFLQQPL